MRVLIAGATAFFAPFIADELVARRCQVAVQTTAVYDWGNEVTVLRGESLEAVVSDWQPEALVDMRHAAAARAQTVVATGLRTIHLSSIAVYGTHPICPIDDDSELALPHAVTAETAARIEADRVVAQAIGHGAPATVLRLPYLYGPRDPRGAEWFFLKRVLDGRPHVAVPDAGLHLCHRGFTQTMARGIAQAVLAKKAVGQVYNLGEEKLYTLSQLARAIARALDYHWEVYSVPGHLWRTPNDHTAFFDLRKARSQLRYRDAMIPRDGLELTLAWMGQSPPVNWSWPSIETPFDYEREDALIAKHGYKLEA